MANGLFNLKQVVQAVQQGGWPAQKPPTVEYLVVAAGGGGSYLGGGGGAGGLLTGIDPVPNGQTLLVTVGSGGAGGTGGGAGVIGGNSVFGQISATGGGRGGSYASTVGGDGGSGGGGNNFEQGNVSGPGQGAFRQGNAGGRGSTPNGANYQGGGGGGAGTVGSVGNPGNGGSGIASAISGTVTTYAGGGGGSSDSGGTSGVGGVGGGGAGGASRGGSGGTGTINGANGTANTGGGGGAYGVSGTGGTGGSGIVVVSYPDTFAAPTATTGSPTVSTSGSGSSYFNGSTWADYPASTSNYATGDFTVESWVYFSTVGAGYTLWISMDPNTTYFGLKNANNAVCNLGNGTELLFTVTPPSTNTWYHYAFVRSGTTITLYINGVSQGTNTSAATLGSGGGAIRIGNAVGYALTGNLSNVRYTKSAVYTSAFTPPTVPLTAIANTRLLLSTVSPSPFNDSSGIAQTPTVTGTSSWSATSPFTVTGYKNRVYTWTSSGSITF